MRIQRTIPKTNIAELGSEVLDKGAMAALPKNLPDRWLKRLARDIVNAQKAAIDGRGEDIKAFVPWIFFVVIALLSHKKGCSPQEHSDDEVLSEVQKYKDALLSELIARQVGIRLIQYDFSNVGSESI